MAVPYYPGALYTPKLGLGLFGQDEVLADNFVILDAAFGSGSSINVNGTLVESPNLNNTLPTAPAGNTNVIWQVDINGNVSAYATASSNAAGSDTQIQYNKASSFGADSNLVWDYTDGALSILSNPTGSGLAALSIGSPVAHPISPGGILLTGSQIGIGTQFACTLEIHNQYAAGISIFTHSNTNFRGPDTAYYRSRGTQLVPLAVQSGDNLCNAPAILAYDGSVYGVGNYIASRATENWNSTSHGCAWDFWVNANGTLGSTLGLTIDNNGHVGVGTNSTPPALLTVGTSNTFQVDSSGNVTSGLVGSHLGSFRVASDTGTGLYTITAPSNTATPTLTLPTTSNVLAGQFAGDNVLYSNTPVGATAAGTLALPTLSTQTANFVFAGPTSGAAAAPTFRALVAADIPNAANLPLWSNLQNAAGALTLANGNNTTTFNQTSNVVWLWANTTTATSGTTNASPLLELVANYWTGAASAADTWTIGSSLAAGTNGASTLTFTHTGSTGAAVVSVPNIQTNTTGSATACAVRVNAANSGFYGSGGGNGLLCSTGSAVIWQAITGSPSTSLMLPGAVVLGFALNAGSNCDISLSRPAAGVLAIGNGTTANNVCTILSTVYGFGSTATATAADSGISRLGAASLAIGNGTAGDFTGALTLGALTQNNNTVATSGTTNASPLLTFAANYWTGAASAQDTWSIGFSLTAGTNGDSFLNIAHSGSTGKKRVIIPTNASTTVPALAFSGQAGVGLGNNAAILTLIAGGSTGEWEMCDSGGAAIMFAHPGAYISIAPVAASNQLFLLGNVSTGAPGGVGLGNNHSFAGTSGTQIGVDIGGDTNAPITFAPPSGSNAIFYGLRVQPTVNANALAVGGYKALVVNAIETALGGTSNNKLLSLQAGATGGTVELDVSNTGTVTTYNSTSTVRNGMAAEYASSDLTAQSAAITATTLLSAPQTGMYKVSWSATITTASDISSVLGGTSGFQVIYTSPTDSVVKTTVPGNSVTSSANTTGTAVGGVEVIYAKTGTNVQFSYGYTDSHTSTAMVYELHVTVEAM